MGRTIHNLVQARFFNDDKLHINCGCSFDYIIIFALLLCPFQIAFAEKTLPTTYTQASLDTISGHRANTSPSAHLFDKTKLNHSSANSVADFLAQQGIFQVKSSGGVGAPTSFMAQGLDLTRIQIVVDGIALNDVNHKQDILHQITIDQIESIEYLPQGQDASLSSSPVGGTLIITTDTQNHSSLSALVGSYRESQLLASTQFSTDSQDWNIYLNGYYVLNNFSYRHNNNTPYNADDDKTVLQQNNEIHRYDGTILSKWKLKEYKIQQKVHFLTEKRGLAGDQSIQTQESFFAEKSLAYQWKISSKQWHILVGHQYLVDEMFWTRDDQIWFSPKPKQSWQTEYHNSQISLHNSTKLANSMWQHGLNLTRSTSEPLSFPALDHLDRLDYRQTAYGLTFGQSITIPIGKSVESNIGHQHLVKHEESGSNQKHVSHYWAANSHLQYQATKDNSFYVELAKRFQEVSLHDRFGLSPGLVPNPELRPETIYKVSLGHSYQDFLENNFYYYQLKDRIDYTISSNTTAKAQNNGDLNNLGLETQLHQKLWQWGQWLSNLKAQQNIQFPRLQTNQANYQDNLPQELSPYTLSATWENQIGSCLRLYHQYIYYSEQWADIANTQKLSAQEYHHSWIQYIHAKFKLESGVKNWFNTKEQKLYQAVATPGRTWFLKYTQIF